MQELLAEFWKQVKHFLTSGFVYKTAEEAEASFKEKKKIFVFTFWQSYN